MSQTENPKWYIFIFLKYFWKMKWYEFKRIRKILAGHYPLCGFVSDPTSTTDCTCRRWRLQTNTISVSEIKQSCDDCANFVDEDYFPCNVCNGIVNYFSVEKTVPMLCFQHGGSEACVESNKKFGFICPKCRIEKIK